MNDRKKSQKKKERERKVYSKVLKKREVLRISQRDERKKDLEEKKSRKRQPIRNDSLTAEENRILQENLEMLTETEYNFFLEKEKQKENQVKSVENQEGV